MGLVTVVLNGGRRGSELAGGDVRCGDGGDGDCGTGNDTGCVGGAAACGRLAKGRNVKGGRRRPRKGP